MTWHKIRKQKISEPMNVWSEEIMVNATPCLQRYLRSNRIKSGHNNNLNNKAEDFVGFLYTCFVLISSSICICFCSTISYLINLYWFFPTEGKWLYWVIHQGWNFTEFEHYVSLCSWFNKQLLFISHPNHSLCH